MNKASLSTFGKLERQKKDVISLYDSLSPGQLRFNPEPGKWNLLQVLRHLVTAEKQSLAYIERKLERHETVPKTGPDSAFRHLILRIALKLPVKYKAPKIAAVTEDYPDYETMKREWNVIRTRFQEIIENRDESVLSKALYRHPRAGLLNINQAMEFFFIHISHHQKQMKRIMASTGFPG